RLLSGPRYSDASRKGVEPPLFTESANRPSGFKRDVAPFEGRRSSRLLISQKRDPFEAAHDLRRRSRGPRWKSSARGKVPRRCSSDSKNSRCGGNDSKTTATARRNRF